MAGALADPVYALIGSAGVAGIWLICIMLGYMFPKQNVDDLKEQLKEKDSTIAAERQRADAIIATERQRADNERARADSFVEAAHAAQILLAGLRRATDETSP